VTPEQPVDRALRFETFVVGSSNRLATSAARAVAEAPAQSYNPLFVYGASGCGKTHLVAAIANRASEVHPALRVRFSSGEEVADHLHRVIASGQPQLFLSDYQPVDLLILDDVQFLTGQRETQSELLRLLNALLQGGQQLVLTSDRQPSEIADVDQRLLSRLAGGLVVDVGAPDFEMRLAILRNVSQARTVTFADGVLEAVARLPFANVRELKGALNKLTAYQQLEGMPISAGDVRAVLGEGGASALPERIEAIIPAGTDYDGFLADVLQEVELRVEPWRVRLGEAIARWKPDGWSVAVLERAMALPMAPDVEGLLQAYAGAVAHLQGLEAQAATIDPALRGHAAFRDVEAIPAAQQLVQQAMASALPLPAPSPAFTRASLDAGPEHQLVLRAIDAVIDEPGQRYNPLLLHGPSGSGKTHSAHAIGNAMRARWPDRIVACLSAAVFVEELIAAMQEGGTERWRGRYRRADVFILDDIQLLEGKERTQEELFHLFNHLVGRGSQVVLTSDRAPRTLLGLADRLRSRFEGGLVAALPARERPRLEQLIARAPGERDHFFEDREKTIWAWPDLGGRLIEEYR
jgi:chromosomal replication initiator protein